MDRELSRSELGHYGDQLTFRMKYRGKEQRINDLCDDCQIVLLINTEIAITLPVEDNALYLRDFSERVDPTNTSRHIYHHCQPLINSI